jgi:hypothetical protein
MRRRTAIFSGPDEDVFGQRPQEAPTIFGGSGGGAAAQPGEEASRSSASLR